MKPRRFERNFVAEKPKKNIITFHFCLSGKIAMNISGSTTCTCCCNNTVVSKKLLPLTNEIRLIGKIRAITSTRGNYGSKIARVEAAIKKYEESVQLKLLVNFIDKYNRKDLTIAELHDDCLANKDIYDYVLDRELLNIKLGNITPNTITAIAVLPDLYKYGLGLPGNELLRLCNNFSGIPCDFALSSANLAAFFRMVLCKEDERSLEMLMNAGIVKRDKVALIFSGISETDVKENFSNVKLRRNKLDITADGFLKLIKSNHFLRNWVSYGYCYDEDFKPLDPLNECFNYRYSDLRQCIFNDRDLNNIDLSHSCVEDVKFKKCKFGNANLKGIGVKNVLKMKMYNMTSYLSKHLKSITA
ncbi:hypothetical protein ACQYRI_10665 [Salmonella enterica]